MLVGSVPLADADAVFAAAGAELGPLLDRMPDGETGERAGWIGWQSTLFAAQTALEQIGARERDYQHVPPYRLRPGRSGSDVRFGDLGYARTALASYARFTAAREAGIVPAHVRFQTSLPTPWAPVYSCIAYASQAAVYPAYEAALADELARICAAIPHRDLSVQWDVATEMSWLEDVYPAPMHDAWDGVVSTLAQLGARVPGEVELGYHLCYGSMRNRHWKEPQDTAVLVRLCNALAAAVPRRIDWLHVPVPANRSDDAYFAPLRALRLGAGTAFYLGVVGADGVAPARRRIEAAARILSDFGIAAECGLGRYDPATVPELLRVHAQAARRDAQC